MFCPKCGASAPDGARFCGECGTAFRQEPAPTAAAPTAPMPAVGGTIRAFGSVGQPGGAAPAMGGTSLAGWSVFDYAKIACALIVTVCATLSWLKLDFGTLLSAIGAITGERVSLSVSPFTYSLLGIGDGLRLAGNSGAFMSQLANMLDPSSAAMFAAMREVGRLSAFYNGYLVVFALGLLLTVFGAGISVGGSRKDTILRVGLVIVGLAAIAFIVIVLFVGNAIGDEMGKYMAQYAGYLSSSATQAYAQLANAMRSLIGITPVPIVAAVAAVAGVVCSFMSAKAR